jgi:type II secretory ATPase GspE/PulE/Tfp pilus assembly ATPase PilB-like protein
MNLKFDWTVLQAVWCEKCNKTWYIGRVTIVETFEISVYVRGSIPKASQR